MTNEESQQLTVVVADTDVLSMFIRRDAINYFIKLFKKLNAQIIVPRQVVDEFEAYRQFQKPADTIHQLERENYIKVQDILPCTEEYSSYIDYTEVQYMGKGEAAALSIAANYEGEAWLASNNLRDVKDEIEKKSISLYTTATVIRECVDREIITKDRASKLWKKMLSDGERLPDETYEEYIDKYQTGIWKY